MRPQANANHTVAWLAQHGQPEAVAGHGFLVAPDVVLTCAHVVRDHLGLSEAPDLPAPSEVISLRFEGLQHNATGRVAPSGWWPSSGGHELADIAIILLDDAFDEVDSVGMVLAVPPPDLACYVFGATTGYQATGQTVEAKLAINPNNRGWRQIDARPGTYASYFVQPGFSGAPVLDAITGSVWGMVNQIEMGEGLRVAFAMPAELLRKALRVVRARQTPVPRPADDLARKMPLLDKLHDGAGPPPEQLAQLRWVLGVLADQAREPVAKASVKHALARLAEGKRNAAMALFEDSMRAQEQAGQAAFATAAAAARHLGALAFDDNTAKAIEGYQTATRLAPEDVRSWIFLGRLQLRAGNLAAAEQAYGQALSRAQAVDAEHDIMALGIDLGDVQLAQGKLADARGCYEGAQAIAQRLAAQDPGNVAWQRDLSGSHDRIGDVLQAEGDLAGALAAYQASHAIRQRLAAQDPGNVAWQRDLSISHDRIGDVQRAEGDLAGALAAYQASHAIAQRLAEQDPGNVGLQRDLSVSHYRIGDVTQAEGDLAGALAAYQASLAIAQRLATRDQGNAAWQRDLAVSHSKIGDVQWAQGDLAGALAAFQASHAIAQRLADQDPGNAEWQRDLSVSYDRIGEVKRAEGDLAGALASYQASHAIAQRLAAQDPGNAGWHRDLSVSHNKIGNMKRAEGDLAGALAAYQASHAIFERLAAQDPGNAGWQRDLIISNWKLADVAERQNDPAEARVRWRLALELAHALADAGRLAPVDHHFIKTFEQRLAALGEH